MPGYGFYRIFLSEVKENICFFIRIRGLFSSEDDQKNLRMERILR